MSGGGGAADDVISRAAADHNIMQNKSLLLFDSHQKCAVKANKISPSMATSRLSAMFLNTKL